jgi:HD-GYP domain-containing protein (c-di-GMP phosphodiesterase class II)
MESTDTSYENLLKYTNALSIALGYRDPLTQLHSERVVCLSAELGAGCRLSEKELGTLKIAACFHDIGKIGIPDPILLKPGAYNEQDWQVMKKHPQIGADIMAATRLEGAVEAAEVIASHHEHYDGSGYPRGESGENISILSRIITITDAYDAMTMTRSYHHARPHQEVMTILHQETGKKFDPYIMNLFDKIIETSQCRVN